MWDQLTFTLGDSLLTWDPDYAQQVQGDEGAERALKQRVLTPQDLCASEPLWDPLTIEAQLWAKAPAGTAATD